MRAPRPRQQAQQNLRQPQRCTGRRHSKVARERHLYRENHALFGLGGNLIGCSCVVANGARTGRFDLLPQHGHVLMMPYSSTRWPIVGVAACGSSGRAVTAVFPLKRLHTERNGYMTAYTFAMDRVVSELVFVGRIHPEFPRGINNCCTGVLVMHSGAQCKTSSRNLQLAT